MDAIGNQLSAIKGNAGFNSKLYQGKVEFLNMNDGNFYASFGNNEKLADSFSNSLYSIGIKGGSGNKKFVKCHLSDKPGDFGVVLTPTNMNSLKTKGIWSQLMVRPRPPLSAQHLGPVSGGAPAASQHHIGITPVSSDSGQFTLSSIQGTGVLRRGSDSKESIYRCKPLSDGGVQIYKDNPSSPVFYASPIPTLYYRLEMLEQWQPGMCQIISSEVMAEIQNPENTGVSVVLPSQFNGAEYPSPASVIDKVQLYTSDRTGGPRGQLACDPGVAQFILDNATQSGKPDGINALSDVLTELNSGAAPEKQFQLVNGYLKVPTLSEHEQAMCLAILESILGLVKSLHTKGVVTDGFDPALASFSSDSQPVNLFYASAVPVNYGGTFNSSPQKMELARAVSKRLLVAQYYGAIMKAYEYKLPDSPKAKVLLMPLGGGVFSNKPKDIADAMKLAMVLAQEKLTPEVYDNSLDVQVLLWDGKSHEGSRIRPDEYETYQTYFPESLHKSRSEEGGAAVDLFPTEGGAPADLSSVALDRSSPEAFRRSTIMNIIAKLSPGNYEFYIDPPRFVEAPAMKCCIIKHATNTFKLVTGEDHTLYDSEATPENFERLDSFSSYILRPYGAISRSADIMAAPGVENLVRAYWIDEGYPAATNPLQFVSNDELRRRVDRWSPMGIGAIHDAQPVLATATSADSVQITVPDNYWKLASCLQSLENEDELPGEFKNLLSVLTFSISTCPVMVQLENEEWRIVDACIVDQNLSQLPFTKEPLRKVAGKVNHKVLLAEDVSDMLAKVGGSEESFSTLDHSLRCLDLDTEPGFELLPDFLRALGPSLQLLRKAYDGKPQIQVVKPEGILPEQWAGISRLLYDSMLGGSVDGSNSGSANVYLNQDLSNTIIQSMTESHSSFTCVNMPGVVIQSGRGESGAKWINWDNKGDVVQVSIHPVTREMRFFKKKDGEWEIFFPKLGDVFPEGLTPTSTPVSGRRHHY